jgi:hypothetical protein
LFVTDIVKVLYAPKKAFKQIVENPKYWGAIVIFILFIAAQTSFYYSLYGKTYYEETSPISTQLSNWTQNTTLWQASSGVAITNNYADFMNNTYYGNRSLQFEASNSNNISLALGSFDSVRCGLDSFQNLSMRIKIADPIAAPTQVTLTLYSLVDSKYFQYDMTSSFSNSSVDSWNNITIPVGLETSNWQSSGNPTWANITSLKLDFTFSSSSNINLRVDGLFFRGVYKTPMQSDGNSFIIYVLQQALFQFIFEWLLFTGLMYVIIKGLKGNVTWKPLFIAVGFALIVSVIQAIIGIVSTTALPNLYYPTEFLTGLSGEAQIISNSIVATTATYTTITAIISLVAYAWLAALGALIVRALIPEFTWAKSMLASAAAIIVTVILMSVLGV